MSRNKGKDSNPELLIRRLLWQGGLRGYRLHAKGLPGRPDICFTSRKVAIFVNGCYWHRCPHCNYGLPKHNRQFWKEKFERNVSRDREKNEQLLAMGWRVITIWECQLKKHALSETFEHLRNELMH